jgi:hypothetical protein
MVILLWFGGTVKLGLRRTPRLSQAEITPDAIAPR